MNIFMFTDDSSFEVSFLERKECCLCKLLQHLVATQDNLSIPRMLTFISNLIYQTGPMFQDFIARLIHNQF